MRSLRRKAPTRHPHVARKALKSWFLPAWWITKVLAALDNVSVGIHGVHVFAGQRAIDIAFEQHVGRMASVDVCIDESHDILTAAGLEFLLLQLVSCFPGGLVWMGVPCCSWVFLSRSVSKRSVFLPRGPNSCSSWVHDHNTIQTIASYIALTANALQLQYVIEQPVSSLLFAMDFRQPQTAGSLFHSLLITKAIDASVSMLSFAGPTRKTLKLKGTSPWLRTLGKVSELASPKQSDVRQALASTTMSKRGRVQVTGNKQKHSLRGSVAYTTEFGIAVALAFIGHDASAIVEKISRPAKRPAKRPRRTNNNERSVRKRRHHQTL